MRILRRLVTFAAGVALIAFPVTAAAVALSKETGARLAFIRAQGIEAASLVVAARPGQTAAVAATVQRLGGRIRYRFDGIDYLHAILPTAKVEAFLAEPAVESVTLDQPDEGYPYYAGWFTPDTAAPEEAHDKQTSSAAIPMDRGDGVDAPWPPRPGTRPLDHPYSILKDMDAQALRDRRPTYDGRGVVVAHVEWFPDFLLPELQVAYDLDGRRVRKFLDVVNFSDEHATLDEEPSPAGPEWVRLGAAVSAGADGTVQFNDARFRLPGAGRYRLGELVIPNVMPFNLSFKVLRAAYKKEKRGEGEDAKDVFVFPLAWSDEDNTLWMDLDRDEDFSNDTPVVAFSQSGRFGVLGRDDLATPERETIGFAVQKDGDYVSISMGLGRHATVVAGAVAANRGDHGRLDGVAPGAQLLVINHGSRASTFARALIAGFSDPRSDVVLVEGRHPVTALHNLKDGRSTLAIVHQRLVQRYRKPVFFTADNTPGMSTSADAANGKDVLSVGAYQSAASVFAHRGIRTRYPDDLHWVGSEGPSGLGALKPDFLSPANPMTLSSAHRVEAFFATYPGIFELPPGYGVGGGTSTATPVATGAAAVMISAAKQKGLAWDADSINRALRSTTRFLPDIPAYKQGRGLIQVEAAWHYLQAQAGSAPMTVTVDAPVRTSTSHLLPVPNRGRGLFEREGWSASGKGSRTVTLTRTGGPDRPVTFDVEWDGNQAGSFSSAKQVTLALNRPAPLEIAIDVKEPGAYSANALLRHASLPGVVAHIAVTIIAPYEFDADNGFSQEVSFKLNRPGRRNLFFRVPEGTAAFSVDLSSDRKSLVGRIFEPDNRGEMRYILLDAQSGNGAVTISNPTPGVWQLTFLERMDSLEFDWKARNEAYLPPVDVRLKASVSAASIEAASAAAHAVREVSFENRMAAFTGAAQGTIGALHEATDTLMPGGHRVFDFTVEDGAERLVAEIAPLDGATLDVDLYLYDCTGRKCLPARYGVSYGAIERVLIDQPRGGAWKAVVSSQGAEGQPMRFRYRDFYTHPRFGALHLTDARATHATGERWSAQAKAWLAQSPGEGRVPVGVLTVTDPAMREVHRGKIDQPGEEWWKAFALPTGDSAPLALQLIELR